MNEEKDIRPYIICPRGKVARPGEDLARCTECGTSVIVKGRRQLERYICMQCANMESFQVMDGQTRIAAIERTKNNA